MNSIAKIQDEKEREILKKYQSTNQTQDGRQLQHQESAAARVLQRTYRGHRERRQLRGLSLDPSTRWTEAVKEAQYLALTTPRPRSSRPPPNPNGNGLNRTASEARQNWSRVSKIARRAGADEESSLSSSPSDHDASNPSHPQREARRLRRLAEKQDRIKSAKQMDLSYFLELVDVKHRYGSNLRKYHQSWKEAPTNENFFYWLDEGEGRGVVLEKCSRERLESMQVRYLGREERRLYEVVVDKEGKLCWRKNWVRVDTSEKWKDSIRGIVRVDDPTPPWAHRPTPFRGSSESSGMSSDEEPDPTTVPPPDRITNLKREEPEVASPNLPNTPATPRHSSFHGLFHSKSPSPKTEKQKRKQKQRWIFVADTNNNLYIGIKQAGAFQHSSFLRGSRISAAGLITVKDGQLRILQPRSGHYRTPSHNLRIFIKSLQGRGVDMSMTAVGGSYAAMVGIETYMKTKGRLKGLKEGLRGLSFTKDGEDKWEKRG
ncbi:MAG: hypothetical protein ASARMPRED_003577 [Alectoria sarmentosa]|nr:MAG: hypothetical protein ASARMPRED_003577 [Alectoria sarmentosa]